MYKYIFCFNIYIGTFIQCQKQHDIVEQKKKNTIHLHSNIPRFIQYISVTIVILFLNNTYFPFDIIDIDGLILLTSPSKNCLLYIYFVHSSNQLITILRVELLK